MQRTLSLLTLMLLACLPACRSTKRHLHFVPSPLEVIVLPDGAAPVLARALVSIDRAVHPVKADPPMLLVRLRIENETEMPLELVTERLLLVASSLDTFGTPEILGDSIVAPLGTTTFELGFPYPTGMKLSAPGLTGVNLRFSVVQDGRETTSTATLERYFPPAPDSSNVHWNVGIGTTF